MKNINHIVYPENMTEIIAVRSVRPLPDYRLWLRFANDETRIFDMTPLLDQPVYHPLRDPDAFFGVYLDYGIPTWLDGAVDIAPETLYLKGVSC